MRVGIGYDVHKFTNGRALILGGIEIPHKVGLEGHSDADVLSHAIIDSLLGAAALGDIGMHFPDTSGDYKNISSLILLEKTVDLIKKEGYNVANIDCVVTAQSPKLAPFIDQIRKRLADTMGIGFGDISVKATSTEGLGFEGRQEGISAYAACLLERSDK
ncbi:MAG: 2-C-methyl-D-erythritol 2,4-cyclodiphosphate synthase [Firmicutes bacterium]|nr:2-C-methyl-D-erythritol 2,4-cyclodiphosphate synthase [Bacillota bacterium]